MHFEMNDQLRGLSTLNTPIWDAHVHLWDENELANAEREYLNYGVKKITGIANPAVRKGIEESGHLIDIVYAYYLPPQSFAEHDTKELVECVDNAHENDYSVVKMWFGPRFLDFSETKLKFSINAPAFTKVFSLIEDYNMIMDIHIADPDVWYHEKYKDVKKYRTKNQAIDEFTSILSDFPSIRVVGVHFGCLPENLARLSVLLNKYPNLFLDTASTKWIIRELGKDPSKSRDFIIKYQDRILFATDLSIGWGNRSLDYYSTRLWSQRLFWETCEKNVPLPFPDDDNKDGKTVINGLNLPEKVYNKLYWKNAVNLFDS
ncbi:MAG: amidohydrolase family protein [Candidatus Hodarchaeales archaeon]